MARGAQAFMLHRQAVGTWSLGNPTTRNAIKNGLGACKKNNLVESLTYFDLGMEKTLQSVHGANEEAGEFVHQGRDQFVLKKKFNRTKK